MDKSFRDAYDPAVQLKKTDIVGCSYEETPDNWVDKGVSIQQIQGAIVDYSVTDAPAISSTVEATEQELAIYDIPTGFGPGSVFQIISHWARNGNNPGTDDVSAKIKLLKSDGSPIDTNPYVQDITLSLGDTLLRFGILEVSGTTVMSYPDRTDPEPLGIISSTTTALYFGEFASGFKFQFLGAGNDSDTSIRLVMVQIRGFKATETP